MADIARLLLYFIVGNGYSFVTGEDQVLATDTPDQYYHGDQLISSKNLYRVLIVLFTITAIAVAFFIFKAISGRGHRKTKKYGVLATSGTDVELRRLEDDDEDEDETVFDVNR